ncbi:glycoside hydrolase domain-containing protein [Pedobacter nyackensis]|uniref:Glycoside hydrolase 123-like N-terminal domain-containing protein n=1 Tax=Pedobacter nyackensis TaxID=475255 RepID=A0A1W2A1J6_9SPHI|nr:glycoside hydrolase domain-containing protein [Pedobacter nyackensis]SMC54534.1 hypothetical protein SAMN04488101_101252 [Pedobacter nyackensis]
MNRTIALFLFILLAKSAAAQNVSTALVLKDKSISMSGKQLDINTDGLPAMIKTSFNLVTEPIHFHVVNASTHKDIKWKNGESDFKSTKKGQVSWTVKNTSDSLNMDINGVIKADGMLTYTVKITALNDINLENIRLHIPFTTEAAKSIKGLGIKEGLRPEVVDWKWNAGNVNQDEVWVGNVSGGLQYKLTDQQHKNRPVSWSNEGQGGIHIEQKGKAILADNYSGEHHMKKGDILYYNFNMLITSTPN